MALDTVCPSFSCSGKVNTSDAANAVSVIGAPLRGELKKCLKQPRFVLSLDVLLYKTFSNFKAPISVQL